MDSPSTRVWDDSFSKNAVLIGSEQKREPTPYFNPTP
jgi:hypothetical protein